MIFSQIVLNLSTFLYFQGYHRVRVTIIYCLEETSNCPSNSTPTSNQTILQIVLTQMPLKHKLDYVSPLLKTFQWLTMIPRPNVFHGLRL